MGGAEHLMPRLFVLSGPDVGASYSFDDEVDLGRAPGVAVVLHAPSVSRRHAQIVRADGRWFLVDLDSVNGTSVGGRRIEREELADGTCFELGELELRFRLDARSDPSPSGSTTVIESDEEPIAPDPDQNEEPGLELEGDWDASVPAPAAPSPAPGSAPRPSKSARKPTQPSSASTAGSAALAATQVRRGEQSTAAGGRVLQYKSVQERSGFLSADLAQYPAWVRLGVLLVALAIFAGLVYGAFHLTTMLRTGTG